jgi:GNAT superfamily N-acetyltransferase
MPSCSRSWSGWPRTRCPAVSELRPVELRDLPELVDVFFRSSEDLALRQGRPVLPRHPAALEEHLRHLVGTDPSSSVVAEDDGRVVAFGILSRRGRHGFLSFLFVLPDRQGRGLGRAVLHACLRGAVRPERMGTMADADQPVSLGLYASEGMVPRVPVYVLRGVPAADALPGVPKGLRTREMTPDASAAVDALDERLLGYARPIEHAFWAASRRRGWLLEEAGGGLLGYGYAQPSGRIGPVAAEGATRLPVLLGHLARSLRVNDAWQVLVPGPAATALRLLLASGLRIDRGPGVFCADHDGPAFDRYLPMSFALL